MPTFKGGVFQYGGAPVGFGANPFSDTTWFVDNTSGVGFDANIGYRRNKPFATIGAATLACSDGDTIYVRGTGTDYDEAVTLANKRVTMIGVDFGVESGGWNADADSACLTIAAGAGSRITGFLFRPDGATTGGAINISETAANDNDDITIDNCVFKSTGTTAAYGIMANGCPGYIKVLNNHFTWIVTAITATSASNTSATGWEIIGNYFSNKCR